MIERLLGWGRSRFARDVASVTVARYVGLGAAFAQGILAARELGPASYGLAVLIMALPDLTLGIADARTSEATVRYLHEFQASDDGRRSAAVCRFAFLIDLAVALVTISLLVGLGGWAARVWLHGSDSLGLLYVYSASLIPRSVLPTSLAILTVANRFEAIAKIEAATSVLKAVVVVTLVMLGWGVAGVVVGGTLFGCTRSLMMASFARKSSRIMWSGGVLSGRVTALRGRIAEISRFVAFGNLAATAGVAIKQGDVLLIGAWGGDAMAGQYRVARAVPDGASIVASSLGMVAYQRLSAAAARKDWVGMRRDVRRFCLTAGIPLMALMLLAVPFVPLFVELTVGEAYLAAVPAAQFFMASAAAGGAFFWLRGLCLAMGHPGLWAAGNALTLVVFVLLGVPMMFRFGATGLAAAFAIANWMTVAVLAVRETRELASLVEGTR